MNKSIKTMLKVIFCAGTVFACLATARAQIQVTVGFPTPEFIATAQPVFYGGSAAYWYGGRWYYRNGNAWLYYRDEPAFLRGRRMQHAPVRQFYGRAHGGGYRGGRGR